MFCSVCLSPSFSECGSKFSELQNPFLCDSWYQCFWHLFFIQCVPSPLAWKRTVYSFSKWTLCCFHLNFFTCSFFFFFCVLYCLFVCCLFFWGICYQFLNQQLLRNAEMDDCRIRALALFSFCVIWNIVLWVHIKCWDSLHKCLYLFICMCLNMITLWDTKLALKKKCRRLLLGQTVAFPLQSDILSCFDVHWKWIVGIFISVSRLLGM